MQRNRWTWVIAVAALAAVVLAVVQLERARGGVQMTDLTIGTTPATLIQRPGATGPAVVVAPDHAGIYAGAGSGRLPGAGL
jgi:hypothetical protein